MYRIEMAEQEREFRFVGKCIDRQVSSVGDIEAFDLHIEARGTSDRLYGVYDAATGIRVM